MVAAALLAVFITQNRHALMQAAAPSAPPAASSPAPAPAETAAIPAAPAAQSVASAVAAAVAAAVPPAPPPAPAAKPQPTVPTFDVVRIDPQGNAVIAGKAAPGAKVKIFDGKTEIGEVTADVTTGDWVFVPTSPLPPGNRQLTLAAIGPDGVEVQSHDQVVLAVPADHSAPAIAVRMARNDVPLVPPLAVSGSSAAIAASPAAPATGNSISVADVPRLLQGGQPLPQGKGIAIDAVNYDEHGHIVIVGRATAGAIVHVMLDGIEIASTTAADDGQWAVTPTAIASEGKHAVHAELRDGGGAVLATVDRPFYRVEVAGMPNGLRVVVVPGNNLWMLANRTYGDGRLYTVIYDANKGQIAHPDLIYPGQVFVLPKADSKPGSPAKP